MRLLLCLPPCLIACPPCLIAVAALFPSAGAVALRSRGPEGGSVTVSPIRASRKRQEVSGTSADGCVCIGLRPRVYVQGHKCIADDDVGANEWCWVAEGTCRDQQESKRFSGWHWSMEACRYDTPLTHPTCSSSTKQVLMPVGSSCPQECPYTQKVPSDPCSVLCIRPQECAQITPFRRYADPATKTCIAPCPGRRMPGCLVCDGMRCLQCRREFRLVDGVCDYRAHDAFVYIYMVLGGLLLILLWYIVCLFRRPVINGQNHALALRHRHICRPMRLDHSDDSWQPYDFIETDISAHNVGGIGAQLFFRWLYWALVMSVVWTVVAYLGYELTDLAASVAGGAQHCTSISVDARISAPVASAAAPALLASSPGGPKTIYERMYKDHSKTRCVSACVAYVLSVGGIFGMLLHQLRDARKFDIEHKTHSDFALWVSGLPADVVCPTPIQEHFDRHFAGEGSIVGVSIGYQFRQDAEEVQSNTDLWMEELERGADVKVGQLHSVLESDMVDSVDSTGDTNGTEFREAQWHSLDGLDAAFLGTASDRRPAARPPAAQLEDWVRSFQGSGDALLVLSSEALRERLLAASRVQGDRAPAWVSFEHAGKKYPLTFYRVHNEPLGIIWSNFAKQQFSIREFCCRLAVGTIQLLAAILVYTALLFVYVMYYRKLIQVPGVRADFFEDVLIGLLSALGNVLVVEPTVNRVCDNQGFRRKDRRDALRMILLFAGNIVNVILDLYVATVVAEQILLDNAFYDKLEGPGNVLVDSVASIVFPGYLLLCPFAVFLASVALPYLVYSGLLKTRNVGRRDCERYMEPLPNDIVIRYSEVLANFAIVLSLGFSASNRYWQLLAMFSGYVVCVIFMERKLLLHYASEMQYTTGRLAVMFATLWIVPSAGQALLAFWWAFKAGYIAWWSGPWILIGHVVVFLGVRSHILQ